MSGVKELEAVLSCGHERPVTSDVADIGCKVVCKECGYKWRTFVELWRVS